MLIWHTCLLLGSTSLATSIFSKDNCHWLVLLDSTFFLPQVKQVCDFSRLLASVVFHILQGVFMEPVEVALFLSTKLPPHAWDCLIHHSCVVLVYHRYCDMTHNLYHCTVYGLMCLANGKWSVYGNVFIKTGELFVHSMNKILPILFAPKLNSVIGCWHNIAFRIIGFAYI